MEYD
jgi:hypothetical protein